MKIKPDDHWRWYFDSDYERLMLDLANGMIFRSCFPEKMLAPFSRVENKFTVEDAASYYSYEDKSRALLLSPELQSQLVLNALVALRFLKPQMPKSWYFSLSPIITLPVQGELVEACVCETGEKAIFIVAEAGTSACLCLLAQGQLYLPDRTLRFCDPIKIMNDRLFSYEEKAQSLRYGNVI